MSGHTRPGPPATAVTRELACLALGHLDAERTTCTATDEVLMRELIEEVQRLRAETDHLLSTLAAVRPTR